ncbi:MAG: glycoside hydrolase [Ignavibacteria bacterium GWA2_35_9]|nr:MAG: glycoside hydrolase [Ignavibacteria bacterium GWA2_35_9]OGU43396.1 MAG: glycoside hydrolase [Ignavibacteria bacterium GWB2_36_8]OGU50241.1 MAG: glycoside hydrolase [Ignavibacteria bacterium GWC2_36_12]
MSLPALEAGTLSELQKPAWKFPRYRGFNLTQKTGGVGPRRKFEEEDFEIMADWGFDFARIPMSYWNWSSKDDWFTIDEDVMKDIDEVIELGKQYNVHVNLNFHRVPGYCINGRDQEPVDLFEDTPENMQKALDGTVYHWRYFAKRYKGIPNSQLSFDLINEPPKNTNEPRYIEIIKALTAGIREEDPERLIVADGKDIGRNPILGISDIISVQSTRGYDPMSVSHYTATWVPEDEFETFNFPTWPIKGDDGKLWDKVALKEKLIGRWQPLIDQGVSVHVGEWGCYNKTPHDVVLSWMKDILSLWKEAGWGYAMWNLKGAFGVLNSERADVKYDDYKGHKLDREMLELLKEY